MYAVIEDSGSQMKLKTGEIFDIDLRPDDTGPGTEITFDQVLLIGDGDGGEAKVGTPYLEGASVTAKVIEEKLGDKIDVIKFKRRKGYRRKTGHRQKYLRVEVTAING